METMAKFRADVVVMGKKLKEATDGWQRHLARLMEEIETVEKQSPTPINRDTWATQQNISQALHRLGAIDNNLLTRKAGLTERGESWAHTSLQQRLIDTMRQPPVGSESVTSQLISAVAEAENELADELLHLLKHEAMLSERLLKLSTVFCVITGVLDTKSFAAVCNLQEGIETIESLLFEDADLENDERCELQDTLEKYQEDLQTHASTGYGIMYFGLLLSEVGIKTARQTLISEFFEAVDPEIEADTEVEGDTEMVDNNDIEDGTEVEDGTEGNPGTVMET